MAYKLARRCSAPLCPNKLPCPKHSKLRFAWQDSRRESSHARGYDSDWRRLRDQFIREFPLCRMCEERGLVVLGQEVDHIIPIAEAPELRLDSSNLQHLCKACHSRKTMSETRRKQRG